MLSAVLQNLVCFPYLHTNGNKVTADSLLKFVPPVLGREVMELVLEKQEYR